MKKLESLKLKKFSNQKIENLIDILGGTTPCTTVAPTIVNNGTIDYLQGVQDNADDSVPDTCSRGFTPRK